MNRNHLASSGVVLAFTILFSACGDSGGGAPTASGSAAKPAGSTPGSAKPAASAKPATTTTATAASSDTAAPVMSGSAPPVASGSAGPAASGAALPSEVQKLVDGLKDPVELKDPKLEGFFFKAPKGATLASAPVPGQWSEITADGATMAFLAHSQSDGGEGCPKMADMKKKVQGATDVLSAVAKLKPWGKESLGDSMELWVFEKDGKAGFYGTKTFDKRDDDVTYCCAAGKAGDAEQLKTLVDKPKAEMLAGICAGIVNKF